MLRNKTTNEVVKYRQMSRFIRTLPEHHEGSPSSDSPASAATAFPAEKGGAPCSTVQERQKPRENPGQCASDLGGISDVELKTKSPREAKDRAVNEEPPISATADAVDNAFLRANLPRSVAVPWAKRMPQNFTIKEAAAALAESRNLYDKGRDQSQLQHLKYSASASRS